VSKFFYVHDKKKWRLTNNNNNIFEWNENNN
jgi:hypothetical protein